MVAEDQALERNDLEERLIRLGYHKVEGHPKTPGEFSRRLLSLEIYLNSFDYPEGRFEAAPFRVRVSFGHVGSIENAETGERLSSVRLEPESLGILSGGGNAETPESVTLPHKLVVRSSTAPPPRRLK